jgi:hypothetical protein
MLKQAGYQVNQVSYGSVLGQNTDFCHWRRKFSEHMDDILKASHQDEQLPEGVTNQIVAFKSCFTVNELTSDGKEPGDPDSCELTVANAKAAYSALLPEFAKHPGVLFIAITPPPNAPPSGGLKGFVRNIVKQPGKRAARARDLNRWLVGADGWLADYKVGNVAVFDYYGILAGNNQEGWSSFPSGDGHDSHPSKEGNTKAANEFVRFLEDARSRHGSS